MPPPELQPGETLEPIGAASAAVVAQGTAAHPELKEGETLEPIGATKAAGDETKTPDPGVWEGIKTGGRNLLGFVKGAAQDLANPDVNVGLSKEPGSISERMQGDDTMGEKYLWAPARQEKQRSLEEADQYAAAHGWEAVKHAGLSLAHTAGEFVPGIGPIAGHLVDKAFVEHQPKAAFGEGLTYAVAPKAMRKVGEVAGAMGHDIPGVRRVLPPSTTEFGRRVGQGPVGKVINHFAPDLGDRPPVYPGAHLPEAPTETYPGAPEPTTPPREVLQGRGLARPGQAPPEEAAAALARIPAPRVTPEPAPVYPGASYPAPAPLAWQQSQVLAHPGAPPAPEPAAALGRLPVPRETGGYTPPAGYNPAKLGERLNESLGGKGLEPNIRLRDQFKGKAEAEPVAVGHTAADSSAVKSYKYDPAAQELHVSDKTGKVYVYAEVTPEEAQNFLHADSKGKAWKTIRDNHVRVANVTAEGKRIPIKGATEFKSQTPESEAPGDLVPALKKSLELAKKKNL